MAVAATIGRCSLNDCGQCRGTDAERNRCTRRSDRRHAACRGRPDLYECKTGTDGKLLWTFREPIATLLLDGKTVGRHYAGPNWEHIDGSAVAAKVAANAPGKTPNDIPWLKLTASTHRGRGTLSGVTTVQRINTQGGVLAGSCEAAGA